MSWKPQGKLREFCFSKMWPPCLPEQKLKVVNICKMDGSRGLEVAVLCKLFDRFQRYLKAARKNDEKVLYIITLSLGNLMT